MRCAIAHSSLPFRPLLHFLSAKYTSYFQRTISCSYASFSSRLFHNKVHYGLGSNGSPRVRCSTCINSHNPTWRREGTLHLNYVMNFARLQRWASSGANSGWALKIDIMSPTTIAGWITTIESREHLVGSKTSDNLCQSLTTFTQTLIERYLI